MPKPIQLDKYARDERAWRTFADFNYAASAMLFTSNNMAVVFSAATLGQHALEMYLKAALICEGMTVFDPQKVKHLVPSSGVKRLDCVWGHDLVQLARKLSTKRNEFDLAEKLDVTGYFPHKQPMSIEAGFALFDPFFAEMRYPQELKNVEGIGEHEKIVLDALVAVLQPFLASVK